MMKKILSGETGGRAERDAPVGGPQQPRLFTTAVCTTQYDPGENASSHRSASTWGGIEEGDEVSPWVSHVSWHMMMFSFPH
jgi:hypothetical protein